MLKTYTFSITLDELEARRAEEVLAESGLTAEGVIRLILERNGLKNPVYVGDTQGDYEACKKADVPFIWAAYGFGRPEDEKYFAKIEKFCQLEDYLN